MGSLLLLMALPCKHHVLKARSYRKVKNCDIIIGCSWKVGFGENFLDKSLQIVDVNVCYSCPISWVSLNNYVVLLRKKKKEHAYPTECWIPSLLLPCRSPSEAKDMS